MSGILQRRLPIVAHFVGVVAATALFAACTPAVTDLEDAAASYRKSHEYDGLEIVTRHLRAGTPTTEVKRLLGEPDYCPASGLCYYSSNRKAHTSGGGRPISLGLVVDYRESEGVSSRLQKFWLGPIEE